MRIARDIHPWRFTTDPTVQLNPKMQCLMCLLRCPVEGTLERNIKTGEYFENKISQQARD